MKTILTAEEAAKEIGCRPEKVRMRMRQRIWNLGRAIPPEKAGTKVWTYEIMRNKLDAFLGKEGENEQNHAEG